MSKSRGEANEIEKMVDHDSGMTAALAEAVEEASQGAVFAVTESGTILLCNRRFAAMWGIPPSVFAGRSLAALIAWLLQTGDETDAELACVLTKGDGLERGEMTTTDGHVIAWRTAAVPENRPASVAGARVFTFFDITLQRQVASSLRDAENWLRMFEAHADGIVLELDSDVRFVGIWASSKMFFEKNDAALQGRPLTEAIGDEQGKAFDSLIRRVFSTGEPGSYEYALDLRGQRHVFAANAVLLPSEPGEPARVTVLIRNVTAHARLQTQLLQAERLATFGLLAAGVAHEINNPLGYLLLNLERLSAGLHDLGQRYADPVINDLLQSVHMSLEGSRRVQEIVYHLKRFSRSEAAEVRVPVDVRRVLAFAVDMASPGVERRATIVRRFGAVPCVLAGDGELGQVFLNLIVNAAQAIPEGAPEKNEIRLVTATDARGRAVVEVHDTGLGMPPSIQQRVFDPFFTTKEPGLGTGLGLAICHGIVTSLGGEISVESLVGRGTVFRVALPATDGEPAV